MIKQFQTPEAYAAAGKPTTESRVAEIVSENEIKVDGVNVRTSEPDPWDVAVADANGKIVIFKGDTYQHALLPSSWKYIGPVFERVSQNQVRALWGNAFANNKYADVIQFKVTVPEQSGTINLGAQFVTAGTTTTISVEYTAGMDLASAIDTYEANDTTLCGRINTALAALSGITGDWWAYLNNSGEVILQRDTWTDYRQYICSGALTFITWEDMPATSASVLKADGGNTTTRGVMNVSGAVVYWSTNGRTPTANVPAHISGDDNPVLRACFDDPDNAAYGYCAALRSEYGTYENYIRECFKIDWPQRFSLFSDTFDAEALTKTYGNKTAPTKGGAVKYKFPAMRWALSVGHSDVPGVKPGEMYLWGAREGLLLNSDEGLAGLNSVQRKASKTQLNNATDRWFAQRYNVNFAWLFNGTNRMLYGTYVYLSLQCGAVSLLTFE